MSYFSDGSKWPPYRKGVFLKRFVPPYTFFTSSLYDHKQMSDNAMYKLVGHPTFYWQMINTRRTDYYEMANIGELTEFLGLKKKQRGIQLQAEKKRKLQSVREVSIISFKKLKKPLCSHVYSAMIVSYDDYWDQ